SSRPNTHLTPTLRPCAHNALGGATMARTEHHLAVKLAKALLLTLLLSSLGASFAQEIARVRAGHLIADGSSLEVWVNGAPSHELAAFKEITDWSELPSGAALLELRDPSDPSVVRASLEASFRTGFRYLVAALGTEQDMQLAVYTDHPALADGTAGCRVINAIPDSDTLRIHSAEACGDAIFTVGPYRFMGPNVRYDTHEYSWTG